LCVAPFCTAATGNAGACTGKATFRGFSGAAHTTPVGPLVAQWDARLRALCAPGPHLDPLRRRSLLARFDARDEMQPGLPGVSVGTNPWSNDELASSCAQRAHPLPVSQVSIEAAPSFGQAHKEKERNEMRRDFTKLGVALLALIAIGAAGASTSLAVEVHSGSGSGTTYFTGTQVTENVFGIDDGTIKCTTTSFKGEYSGTTASGLKIIPTYTGCKALGQSATVHMNGCYWETKEVAGSSHSYTEQEYLRCSPTTNKITITVSASCHLFYGEQGPVGSTDVTVKTVLGLPITTRRKLTVGSLHYSGNGGVCTTGTRSGGTYTGEIELKGYSDSAHTTQVDLWVA
jgi:hypothetical protein